MSSLFLIVKLMIPILAVVGYAFLFAGSKRIGIQFAPLLSVSSIISVLLVSGLLNLLHLAVWPLLAGGLAAFVWCSLQRLRKKDFAFFLHPTWLVLLAGLAGLVLLLRGEVYTNSDEYSHWGTMVREMITVDGLPDASTVIDYKEYPPAAALFMYFVCRVTGFSKAICYMAQGFFALCALVSFIRPEGWKKPLRLAASLAVMVIVMGIFAQTIHQLLVEYLIGLFSVALLMLLYEKEDAILTEPMRWGAYLAPVLLTVSMIKTNALAFYAAALALLVCMFWRQKKLEGSCGLCTMTGKQRLGWAAWLLSPVFCWVLWIAYIRKVYLGRGYATVKFAMTPDNLLRNFTEKPVHIRWEVLRQFAGSLVTRREAIFMILALAAAAAVTALLRFGWRIKDHRLMRALKFSAVLGVGYSAGYVFTLLFLMPYWEMRGGENILICYDRYMAVPAAVIAGYLLYCCLDVLDAAKIKKSAAVLAGAAILLAMAPFVRQTVVLAPDQGTHGDLVEFQHAAEKIPMTFGRDNHLLFFIGEKDDDSSAFNNHCLEKEFLNRNVLAFSDTEMNGIPREWGSGDLARQLAKTDFVILIHDSGRLPEIMEKEGIEFTQEPDCLVYRVLKDEDGRATALQSAEPVN